MLPQRGSRTCRWIKVLSSCNKNWRGAADRRANRDAQGEILGFPADQAKSDFAECGDGTTSLIDIGEGLRDTLFPAKNSTFGSDVVIIGEL